MVDIVQLEQILAPVAEWARLRSDILGFAVVGSWACDMARVDSDIDLMFLVAEPQTFRCDEHWLVEICWADRRVAGWHDADYGIAWSRHVQLEPPCEIEFTFCGPSWAATDPIDPGTVNVVAKGCRILLDKAGLFEKLLAAAAP
jgi:uncharacterized protein